MTDQVMLLIIIGLPLLLGLAYRVSSSNLFFSLMAGELLARYFGADVEREVSALTTRADGFSGYGPIVLLILPMLLTATPLAGRVSPAKLLLHVVPLAITGLVFAAFLLPLLPSALQNDIQSFPLGEKLFNLNKAIIGSIVLLQLIALWLFDRSEPARKRKRD